MIFWRHDMSARPPQNDTENSVRSLFSGDVLAMGGAAGVFVQRSDERRDDEWANDEEPQLVDERCMFVVVNATCASL